MKDNSILKEIAGSARRIVLKDLAGYGKAIEILKKKYKNKS